MKWRQDWNQKVCNASASETFKFLNFPDIPWWWRWGSEPPQRSEFLNLLRISEFLGFQWQNLTEILRLLPKVLQSENEAVIMITSPLYNICLQQMWLFESLLKSRGLKYTKVESTLIHQYTVAMEVTLFTLPWYAFFQRLQVQWLTLACQKRRGVEWRFFPSRGWTRASTVCPTDFGWSLHQPIVPGTF